jgi:arylsulfatase A-like enzyme
MAIWSDASNSPAQYRPRDGCPCGRWGRCACQPASKPPNIIFILADNLGYTDVSCYGRRDFTTPNIDRIAARGMRFLLGYANSAVCSASRLALITGRYQYRLRLGLEEQLFGHPEVGLPPEHPTLPSLLKKAGYGTTLIGKWHLGALCRSSVRQAPWAHRLRCPHRAQSEFLRSL